MSSSHKKLKTSNNKSCDYRNNITSSYSSSSNNSNGRRRLPRSLSLSQLHSVVGYKSGDILNLKERLMRYVSTVKKKKCDFFFFKFNIK